MGVWACSGGKLHFGSRFTGESVDFLVHKLCSDIDGAYLEPTKEWDDDDDRDEDAMITIDELNIRLNYWLKMRRTQRSLVAVVAGVLCEHSPLRLLAGEPGLVKMIFKTLLPTKAPTIACPHEVELEYATTFEGYGQEFPFYLLRVTGKQDAPQFGGEKKLGMWDCGGDCSGIDYCDPIGTFSEPVGGAATLAEAIATLRASEMLPAELTKKEIAETHASGRILMPNVPHVGPIGWNVVGHSHVG